MAAAEPPLPYSRRVEKLTRAPLAAPRLHVLPCIRSIQPTELYALHSIGAWVHVRTVRLYSGSSDLGLGYGEAEG